MEVAASLSPKADVATPVTVVGINLSDVGEDGLEDPLTATLTDLFCAAARVMALPQEATGAVASLTALRLAVREELPELGGFLGQVIDLLEHARAVVAEEAARG